MSIIDTVKAHPVGFGVAGVVAVIAVVLVLGSGSGGTAQATAATGDASTGAALQAAQLQVQAHGQDVAAAQQINDTNNATQIEIAKIQQSLGLATINAQQQLGSMQIEADRATTINGQTLSAQVQNNQITSEFATIQNQTNALVKISQINANAQVQAAQPHGLFSWLFG